MRLGPTKTHRSRRTIPLTEHLACEFQAWRTFQTRQHEVLGIASDHLVTVEGRPLRVDTFRRAFQRSTAASGFQATPHELRHTFATHLIEAGTPTAHVAELLGDTDAMVSSVYAHVLRPKVEVRNVIQRLEGIW